MRLTGRRIVLTAVGSLGDLHPFVAIALGLKARGHKAVIATSECYCPKIEALGLGFRALRPVSASVTDPAVMPRFMHPRWGTVRSLREFILPVLRESYEDTLGDGTEWEQVGRIEEYVYRERPGCRVIFDRERLWLDVEGTSGVAEVRRYLGRRWSGAGAF
jgi:hypothetical protein